MDFGDNFYYCKILPTDNEGVEVIFFFFFDNEDLYFFAQCSVANWQNDSIVGS